MSCSSLNPCGTCLQCTQSYQCPPAPCNTGCLYDVPSDCVFTSKDLDLCGNTIALGTKLTDVLESIMEAACDGIEIINQDTRVKISANDTTTGYLENKIIEGNGINITKNNVGANESLTVAVQASSQPNNCLSVLPDGVFVACPTSSASTLVQTTDTSTIDFTTTSIPGGYNVTGAVKIDNTAGNVLTIGANGLYVPTPPTAIPLGITALDTFTIDTTATLVGSNYNVSSQLRIDPASTLPYSIGPSGLKLDCCATGNTLLTVTDSSTLDLTLTPISGGYNLTGAVILSPNANNGLQLLGNGLYYPNAGATIGVQDTNSIDYTLLPGNVVTGSLKYQDSNTINLDVPNSSGLTAHVKLSTDGGNILVNGTDGALYVPASGVAYSTDSCNIAQAGTDGDIYVPFVDQLSFIEIYNDGTNLLLRFSGISNVAADYEVEFRGTTGSPLNWVNGDINFVSQTSGVLTYTIIGTAAARAACEVIGVRVRTLCSPIESQWISAYYHPDDDLEFISSNNTVSVATTSDCGILDVTIDNTTTCAPFISTDFSRTLVNYDGNVFLRVFHSPTTNNYDHADVRVFYTDTDGLVASVHQIISTYNNTNVPAYILLPNFDKSINQNATIRFSRICDLTHATDVSAPLNVTLAWSNSTYCNDDVWKLLGAGSYVSGGFWTANFAVPPSPAAYKVTGRRELKLAGTMTCRVTFTGDSGWFNVIDLTTITCFPLPTITVDYFPPQQMEINLLTNVLGEPTVLVRRSGNFLQLRCISNGIAFTNHTLVVALSSIIIN